MNDSAGINCFFDYRKISTVKNSRRKLCFVFVCALIFFCFPTGGNVMLLGRGA